MAFQFRFKALLQHRRHLLGKSQTALAAAIRRQQEVQAERERMVEKLEEQHRMWDEKRSRGMSSAEYLSFGIFVSVLERHLLQIDAEIQRAIDDVEDARADLIEREKDLKIIESIEEREREAHRAFISKRDQKRLDESAAVRNFHKGVRFQE